MSTRMPVLCLAVIGWAAAGSACDETDPAPGYKVGSTVPPAADNPSAPSGTVTAVTPTQGYSLVTIAYPPEWTCPDEPSLGTAGYTPAPAPTVPTLSASSCAELASLRRPPLKAQSLATLSTQRDGIVRSKCRAHIETRCIDSAGQQVASNKCHSSLGGVDGGMMLSQPGAANPTTTSPSSSGATAYSTTNNQVANVDEADFVKNDSNTIFVLSADGLRVIDAWPAGGTHAIAHVPLTGEPDGRAHRTLTLAGRSAVWPLPLTRPSARDWLETV